MNNFDSNYADNAKGSKPKRKPARAFVEDSLINSIPMRMKYGGMSEKGKTSLSGKDKEAIEAVIKPLAPTMAKVLQDYGIPPSNNLDVLAQQFYNNVVLSQDVDSFNRFTERKKVFLGQDYADEQTDKGLSPAVSAIITGVLDYVTIIAERKKAGQELTKTQEAIARGAEQVDKQLSNKVQQNVQSDIGGFVIQNKTILIVIGIVVVFLIAFMVAKR